MNIKFSDRISTLRPSAIREILKVTQDPSVISFAAGNPAPESFPAREMQKIAVDLFENRSAVALQYGVSEGYGPLRELTAARIKNKYGIGKSFDGLIITSGGQQVVEIAAKILLNEGDAVLCETPSFIGALNAFRSYNANLVGIPMDEHGMNMEVLEEKLKSTPNVKLIYTIPTFQNPSGTTMSLSRRKELLALAEKYNVIILEDSPYFELRYEGDDIPCIKSLDESGRVIYAGSYSKVLSPGIRIGFACAHSDIIAKMTVGKQVSDVHTNLFFQMITAEYLEKCDIDTHIKEIRKIYKSRAKVMADAMDEGFGARASFKRAEGGLFLWCSMPEGYDGMEYCRRIGAAKVAAVPGASFSVDESEVSPSFRLNFSLMSEDVIKRGIGIMADVMADYVK
ncbi:MAG: PLP-dependent aminotransferase family protein [Clostridia bacterium]